MTSSHPGVHLLLSSTSTTADLYAQMPASASPECLPGKPAAHAQTRIPPPHLPNSVDRRPITRELPRSHPREAESQAYQFCFHTVFSRWLLLATSLPTLVHATSTPQAGAPARPSLPPRDYPQLSNHTMPLLCTKPSTGFPKSSTPAQKALHAPHAPQTLAALPTPHGHFAPCTWPLEVL